MSKWVGVACVILLIAGTAMSQPAMIMPENSMSLRLVSPPNDDCHNAKFEIEIKNGVAIMKIKELQEFAGHDRFGGKGFNGGFRWTVGGERCRISVHVETTR